MYIIWSSVPTPLPPGHGHGSAIVLSPFPPVVWWGVCGAEGVVRGGVVYV